MSSVWTKFCEFSDRLLCLHKPFHFLAILHPSRPTQYFLKQLKSSPLKLIVFLPYHILASICSLLFRFKFNDKNLDSIISRIRDNKADCILFSHYVNQNHTYQNDFYFSPLVRDLVDNGKRVEIIYISSKKEFSRILGSQSTLNLLNPVLSPNISFPYIKFLLTSSLSLISSFLLFATSYSCSFFIVAFRSIFSVSTFYNFYLDHFIHYLKLPLNTIYFTTFEGHSWERVLFSAFRSKHKSSLGYAYQHTLIFDNNHSLLRSSLSHLNPDIILVSGAVQLDIFRKSYNCPIHLIGTHKYTTPRQVAKVSSKLVSRFSILFLPQGLYHESLEHLCLALSIASAFPDLKIIYRTHPLISYSKLVLHLPRNYFAYFALPNFSIHFCPLIESLRISDVAIYSGSTAVLEAIQFGIVPIYFASVTNPSFIDPLWQVNSERISFSSIDEFNTIYPSLSSIKVSPDLQSHVNNLKSSFSPLSSLL